MAEELNPTTTNNDDRTVVTYPYVMGKYVGHIPGIGTFFNFLKTTPGYFLCIFTPFMLIILYEGGRFLALFRKYRGEQMAEMNAELFGHSFERITDTHKWLKRYRKAWLNKNKPSELTAIEKVFYEYETAAKAGFRADL